MKVTIRAVRRESVASAGRGSVRLWERLQAGDAKNGVVRGSPGGVNDVKHVPSTNRDSLLVASGGSDKTVRLWSHGMNSSEEGPDSNNGGFVAVETAAHDDYVMSLATNRDGSSLASGGLGGQLFAWDVETLKQKWSTEGTSLDEYSLKGAKKSVVRGYHQRCKFDSRWWRRARFARGMCARSLKCRIERTHGYREECDKRRWENCNPRHPRSVRVWDISLVANRTCSLERTSGCWAVSGNANFTRFYSGGTKGDICITDIKARKSAILCRAGKRC